MIMAGNGTSGRLLRRVGLVSLGRQVFPRAFLLSSPPSLPPSKASAYLPHISFLSPPPVRLMGSSVSATTRASSEASSVTPIAKTNTPRSTRGTHSGKGVGLIKRVLHIRRVARVNAGGKVRSVTALVVVGDGKGYAGFGEGRGLDTTVAIDKATAKAKANMRRIERHDGRTIYSNMEHTFHRVTLRMKAAPPGYGLVANNYIHEVCRCVGIADMYAKVYGSKNPMNVVKATFEALHSQRKPDDIAKSRGKRLVDVEMVYYGTSSSLNAVSKA